MPQSYRIVKNILGAMGAPGPLGSVNGKTSMSPSVDKKKIATDYEKKTPFSAGEFFVFGEGRILQ